MKKGIEYIFMIAATVILLLHAFSLPFHKHIDTKISVFDIVDNKDHSSIYDLLAHIIHGELDHDHLEEFDSQNIQFISSVFIVSIIDNFTLTHFYDDEVISFSEYSIALYSPPLLQNYIGRGPPIV